MKKYVIFFLLCLYVVGTIGGLGHLLFIHEYVTAMGVAVLAFMGWPTAKSYFKELTD